MIPPRNILAVNCGSSSTKPALVNEAHSLFPLHGLAERLDNRDAVPCWERGSNGDSLMIPNVDYRATLAQLLLMTQNTVDGKFHGVGHRMVHGGGLFVHTMRIGDRVVEAIRVTAPPTPLYSPTNLQGIEAAMTLFPKLSHVTVPDTALCQSLPGHVYRYALSEALCREHGVCHYGSYGTSHRYASCCTVEMAGLAVGDSSWLSTHLGNGSSICVIINGQSLDTSAGLIPLEDLVIDTRSGSVDSNLYSHSAWTLGQNLKRIDSILDSEGGPLGPSDLSNDMRILEQERERGHSGAVLAVEVFYYRLAKFLAAMSCALLQLDGAISTGGIGENSSLVYAKTAAHLRLFDLRFDQEANARCVRGVAGPTQAAGHPRVLVVPTNKERQIALDTLALFD